MLRAASGQAIRVDASWLILSVLPLRSKVPDTRLQPPEPLTRPLLRSNWTCGSRCGSLLGVDRLAAELLEAARPGLRSARRG